MNIGIYVWRGVAQCYTCQAVGFPASTQVRVGGLGDREGSKLASKLDSNPILNLPQAQDTLQFHFPNLYHHPKPTILFVLASLSISSPWKRGWASAVACWDVGDGWGNVVVVYGEGCVGVYHQGLL